MIGSSRALSITMCLGSSSSSSPKLKTEQLRLQLDHLHSEAETTRRKATNARIRLLRLSEAAEKLCEQAAVSVRKGKDDYARELLLQKKKIMVAVEKSKDRVELLDKLAAKLSEATAVKEAQLVENVAADLEFAGDEAGSPVRIVPPTQAQGKYLNGGEYLSLNNLDLAKELEPNGNDTVEKLAYSEVSASTGPESVSSENKGGMRRSFEGQSSYIDFLGHLDQRLNNIEDDVVSASNYPTLALEDEQDPSNSQLQQLSIILEDIRGTRKRIQHFLQKPLEKYS